MWTGKVGAVLQVQLHKRWCLHYRPAWAPSGQADISGEKRLCAPRSQVSDMYSLLKPVAVLFSKTTGSFETIRRDFPLLSERSSYLLHVGWGKHSTREVDSEMDRGDRTSCSKFQSGTERSDMQHCGQRCASREAVVEVEFKHIVYGGLILQGVVHSCRACLVPTRW